MTAWSWLRRRFAGEVRASAQTAPPRDPVIASWWGQASVTASGASVTPDTALQVTAVYRCVKLIAETLSALPLVVYRRTERGKERDPSHPLFELLHAAPNQDQTSFEWREMLVAGLELRGNAYAEIKTGADGRPYALVPLRPDRVTPYRAANGAIACRVRNDAGAERILFEGEILRIPGLTLDGICGLSPIAYHRETVGLSLAAREYLARFYSNAASPKGGLKLPEPISEEAKKVLRQSWEDKHQGLANAHRLAIFDAGMEWVPIGLSNDDAQYLELQQFQVNDIARLFGVPPHMIGDLSKATFSNIEQQAIEFVTYAILPRARRWEDRLNLTLLSPAERRTHVIGFELKGLLRGDSAARGQLYRELWGIGALSANDVRLLEDMDAVPGGDRYFVPLNMAPADKALDILLKPDPAKPVRSVRPPAKLNGHHPETTHA